MNLFGLLPGQTINPGGGSPCSNPADWTTLYRAAILETNRNVILQRISAAETSVLARRRELFHNAEMIEERELLEDALYALRAFRTAWQHTEAD